MLPRWARTSRLEPFDIYFQQQHVPGLDQRVAGREDVVYPLCPLEYMVQIALRGRECKQAEQATSDAERPR